MLKKNAIESIEKTIDTTIIIEEFIIPPNIVRGIGVVFGKQLIPQINEHGVRYNGIFRIVKDTQRLYQLSFCDPSCLFLPINFIKSFSVSVFPFNPTVLIAA